MKPSRYARARENEHFRVAIAWSEAGPAVEVMELQTSCHKLAEGRHQFGS
jgi:hypothetical protein